MDLPVHVATVAMQRHLAVLARRAPCRRAWLEPPSKLRHRRMAKVAWTGPMETLTLTLTLTAWPKWPGLDPWTAARAAPSQPPARLTQTLTLTLTLTLPLTP